MLRALLNLFVGRDVKLVEVVHSGGIVQDLCNLNTCRDELKDVPVVFQWSTLVLDGMLHLQ